MNKKIIQNSVIAIGYCLWAAGAVMFVSLGIASPLIEYVLSDSVIGWLTSPLGALVLSAFIYMLATVIVVLPLKLSHAKAWRWVGEQLAMSRSFRLQTVPWAVFVWGVYMIVSVAVMLVLSSLTLPGLDLEQVQHVGFDNLSGVVEYTAAFLALVVFAPLFEEIIFRGYLFGRLRRLNGFWVSAVFTSLTFGLLHMQFNVGVDVFVLSIFLCFLREKFDSIWPGVLVHALKNSLAYTLLFILPLYGVKLVQ